MSVATDLSYLVNQPNDPSAPKSDDGETVSLQKILAVMRAIQAAGPGGGGGGGGVVTQGTSPWVVGGTVSVGGTVADNLTQVAGSAISLGQKTMANSLPVTIASDQSSLAIAQGTAAAITAGWPIIAGEVADVTGTFTNATQTTSVTTGTISGYESLAISINGTFGTGTAVFEISDDGGTTWYPTQGARTDSATIDSGYTSLTNTSRMWVINCTGIDMFRVRSTAVASGTINVRISPVGVDSSDGATVQLGGAIPTGANVIGAVTQSAGPWTVNMTQVGGSALALGNALMAASIPVTIASNQNTLAISGTVTANIGTSGSLALNSSVTGLQVAQGSTTSGQNGNLDMGAVTTAAPSYTTAQTSPLSLTLAGSLRTDLNSVAGTTVSTGTGAGGAGIPRVTVSNDSVVGSVPTPSATATATATPFQVNNLTNAKQQIKASAGRIYYYHFYNPNGAVAYIQLFDVASASITLGTTPPTRVVAVPPNSVIDTPFFIGQSYGTAINLAATTTATGSSAPTTNLTATVDFI